MPHAITEQSTVECIHKGTVKKVAGQSKLKVSGALVLVDGDLSGAGITLCQNVPPPAGRVACSTATPTPGGVSSRLKVNGKGVLLDTLKGLTNSSAPGTFKVNDACQTRLQAV